MNDTSTQLLLAPSLHQQLPPLPTLPITSTETLQKCKSLAVGPQDIFIASFPKSGTTWMQNIVIQLLMLLAGRKSKKDIESTVPLLLPPLQHISQYAPFYDIDAHWTDDGNPLPEFQEAHRALGYRVFNTHLRWDMLPKSLSAAAAAAHSPKYIYVVRDGRDVLTSFYHHLSNQHPDDGGFQGSFDEFFDQFLEGNVAYGKWSHHLASWMPEIISHATKQTILLVHYKDLKSDLKGQILRVADFLELTKRNDDDKVESESFSCLSRNNMEWLDQVMERVTFEYMRKNQTLFHPISVRWKPGYHFIRSGTVGDYKSLFTDKHQERFMASIRSDFEVLKRMGGETTENDAADQEVIPGWLYDVGFVN